ncbi:MAG: DUF6635 family protein [Tateyamaria sp.]|uniref:DUF6635 family protein n=1 Tax=Tateyamaria sp. TaxID=1929288 RepID=UPI00329DA6C7
MNDQTTRAKRQIEIRAFVCTHFGLVGTLRLHRLAFGADLLRAPANVLLAPLFVIVKLAGLLAKVLRCHKAARWLSGRKILLQTSVSRQVAVRVTAFFADLETQGIGITVPQDVLEREVADYTGVRNAVGEITTTVLVLMAGFALFKTATPGLISLVGPIAELRAYNLAVAEFPLGQGMGKMYYAVFSTQLDTWQVVITGLVLAMLMSVATTFAGVIADPLQVVTGTHRRRLSRLIDRLDTYPDRSTGLAKEHITARFADLTDMALNIWRFIRG